MFDFCNSIQPQSKPCTLEAFYKIADSKVVADNCTRIAQIVDTLPSRPDKMQWAQYKKQIAPYKSGDPKQHIPSLPGFCFHAHFPGGRRRNDDAQLSGLISVDIDEILCPRETFAIFRDDAISLGLLLAYVSPSLRGLKMVFTIPQEAHTLTEAQSIIVDKLKLNSYSDDATTDAARLSFAVPRSYIIYIDEDELFADHEVPIGFTTKADIDAAQAIDPSTESSAPLPENVANERTYKGIAYSRIVDALCQRLIGKHCPEPGERNITLLKAVRYMRTICDDDYMTLLQIMPQWDPDTAKQRATIKNALRYNQSESCYKVMEDIVADLRTKDAQATGKISPWTMPKLPSSLPPVFKEYARVTPPELQPAVMFSLLPMLGIYGSMVKVNCKPKGAEPKYLTPSFITCIVAPPASGKGTINQIHDRLMEPLMKRDEKNIAIFNEWQQNRHREDYKGREPKIPIFNQPERLSMTSLTKQMSNAAGRHILIFTPEIDTLKSSNGSGAWNDLSTVIRKSTDNDKVGQIFMSQESFSCSVNTYLNILMEAQPRTMRQYFNVNTVANGLVDRVNFIELPDNTGLDEVFMRKMKDKDWQKITDILERMFNVGRLVQPEQIDDDGNVIEGAHYDRVEVELPRSLKALDKWKRRHQAHFMQTQENPSEDHFMRRAYQTGVKAALIAFMTNGMKESTAVVNFALWAAETDIENHIYLFGKVWNELQGKNAEAKAANETFTQSMDKAQLFDVLPHEFTTVELMDAERKFGIPDSNSTQKLRRWVKSGYLELTDKKIGHHKVYRKAK